jgi:hypothetical protein
MFNAPVTSDLIHSLTFEIVQLSDRQTEALRTATFGGMSDYEENQFRVRRKRMAELINDLEVLTLQKKAA